MKDTHFQPIRKQFSKRVKRLLLDQDLTIEALSRSLRPPRPRSTVSTAIHTERFPKVRQQIAKKLGL